MTNNTGQYQVGDRLILRDTGEWVTVVATDFQDYRRTYEIVKANGSRTVVYAGRLARYGEIL